MHSASPTPPAPADLQLVAPAALAQTTAAPHAAPTPPPAQTSTPATATAADPAAAAATPERRSRSRCPRRARATTARTSSSSGATSPTRSARRAQVVSVLSTADIARTGEGDIAGALTRVTGLSVVGGGFVYVRGLGDRYSSSLLNGSPLPSPEPLRRVGAARHLPDHDRRLGAGAEDLFGQLSRRVRRRRHQPDDQGDPRRRASSRSARIVGADTATTSELGYTYYGGDADWIGFDDGTRDVPGFIRNAPNGTGLIPARPGRAADQRAAPRCSSATTSCPPTGRAS